VPRPFVVLLSVFDCNHDFSAAFECHFLRSSVSFSLLDPWILSSMAPCSLAPWPLAQSLRTGKNAAWPHDNVDSVGGGSGIKVGKVGGRWRDFDAGCSFAPILPATQCLMSNKCNLFMYGPPTFQVLGQGTCADRKMLQVFSTITISTHRAKETGILARKRRG